MSTPRPGSAAGSSWLFEFSLLTRRACTYKFRDEMVVVTQIAMALIMAVLLGAIYWDLGLSQASVQNRVGAVSFTMLLMSFIAFDVVLLFPKERDLFRREHAAGLYSCSAFFHARCAAELPGHLAAGAVYATVTYWMMGFQRSGSKFANWLALCEALVLAGTSLLIFCGCVAKDFEGANNLATVAYCLFMMFDGHYINNKSIPEGARWIKQLNFFNWGIAAAARSELHGLGDLHECQDPAAQKCVFPRGSDASAYYGYDDTTVQEALGALALIIVALRVLAFLAFKYLFQDHPLFSSRPALPEAADDDDRATAPPKFLPVDAAPVVAREAEARVRESPRDDPPPPPEPRAGDLANLIVCNLSYSEEHAA